MRARVLIPWFARCRLCSPRADTTGTSTTRPQAQTLPSRFALSSSQPRPLSDAHPPADAPAPPPSPQCHRKDDPAPSKSSSVYAVNDIKFHPYGTFATAGSDGTINFWDKESKTRLKSALSFFLSDSSGNEWALVIVGE